MVDRRGAVETDEEAAHRRRRAIRHNCKVAIKMVIGHAAGHSDAWSVDAIRIDGRVLDLSGNGASLFTKHAFETGQELRLAIRLRDGSQINTTAVVRWVKSVPQKNAYASGVEFRNVSPKDEKRITRFLSELDETSGL